MSTERSVEEIAKSCIKFGVWEEELIDLPATEKAIAAALRAERERKAPPGHILDDQGVVRKVLGTLPVTADGCVYGHMPRGGPGYIPVWGITLSGKVVCAHVSLNEANEESFRPHQCYSTRAAAEAAAAKEVQGE